MMVISKRKIVGKYVSHDSRFLNIYVISVYRSIYVKKAMG